MLERTILPWSGGGWSPRGRSRPPGPGPLACADPGGLPGMPCAVVGRVGVGFWLEGGGCLASVPARLQREETGSGRPSPGGGAHREVGVGTWQLESSGGPGASGGLGTLTRSKLLVTRGQGALRMDRTQRAGAPSLGSTPGPLQLHQSARPAGPPPPLLGQGHHEPPPCPHTRHRETPLRQRPAAGKPNASAGPR